MSNFNYIKGLPYDALSASGTALLCADILEIFGEIPLVYVQIPVIIEDFPSFFHICEEFHKGGGVQGGIGGHERAATGAWKATWLYIYKNIVLILYIINKKAD